MPVASDYNISKHIRSNQTQWYYPSHLSCSVLPGSLEHILNFFLKYSLHIYENRIPVAQPENALIFRQSDLTGRKSLDPDCVTIDRTDNILHWLFCYEIHGSKTTSTWYGPHLAGNELEIAGLLLFHSLSLSLLIWCFRARINIRIGSSCIRWVSLFIYYNPFLSISIPRVLCVCGNSVSTHSIFHLFFIFIFILQLGYFRVCVTQGPNHSAPPYVATTSSALWGSVRWSIVFYRVRRSLHPHRVMHSRVHWLACLWLLLWSSSVGPLWSLYPHPTRQHPPTFLAFVSRSVHRSLHPSY